jgi:hypothetical protein
MHNESPHSRGYGGNGQLGQGDKANRGDQPSSMGANLPAVDLGVGRKVLSMSARGGHTCCILDDLTVKCFGENSQGQLGE